MLKKSLRADETYQTIFPDVSVLMMPLSHGTTTTGDSYESSAFFIRHDPTSKEFLFFGGVEPDHLAPYPRTINVWRTAAPKIPHALSTIFIECSWPSGRKDDVLYGHLSPEYLVAELIALATEVVRARQKERIDSRTGSPRKKSKLDPVPVQDLRGALDGLRVQIIHCKNNMERGDRPINHVICDQIRALIRPSNLGVDILHTDQGTRIGERFSATLLCCLRYIPQKYNGVELSIPYRPF